MRSHRRRQNVEQPAPVEIRLPPWNSIEEPIGGRDTNSAHGQFSFVPIHHLEKNGAKEFPPDFRLPYIRSDCQIELQLQAETGLGET